MKQQVTKARNELVLTKRLENYIAYYLHGKKTKNTTFLEFGILFWGTIHSYGNRENKRCFITKDAVYVCSKTRIRKFDIQNIHGKNATTVRRFTKQRKSA